MKRFAIAILVLFLNNSIELKGTAHKSMVSKVRQQCLQRLEYVMRPNNASSLELFRLLRQQGVLFNRALPVQPLVRVESPEITIIWNETRLTKPTTITSVSMVADEDLGYDSDDDVQPLFDF